MKKFLARLRLAWRLSRSADKITELLGAATDVRESAHYALVCPVDYAQIGGCSLEELHEHIRDRLEYLEAELDKLVDVDDDESDVFGTPLMSFGID